MYFKNMLFCKKRCMNIFIYTRISLFSLFLYTYVKPPLRKKTGERNTDYRTNATEKPKWCGLANQISAIGECVVQVAVGDV